MKRGKHKYDSSILIQKLGSGVMDVLVKSGEVKVCLEFITVHESDVITKCCPDHQRPGFMVDLIYEAGDGIQRRRVLDLPIGDAKKLMKAINGELNRIDPFWIEGMDETKH